MALTRPAVPTKPVHGTSLVAISDTHAELCVPRGQAITQTADILLQRADPHPGLRWEATGQPTLCPLRVTHEHWRFLLVSTP